MSEPATLYVSGPMSGLPGFNYPAFHAAAARLRAAGYRVVSPAELDADNGVDVTARPFTAQDRRDALARDTQAIAAAGGVAVLYGWEDSDGARAEVALACAAGIPVMTVAAWTDRAGAPLLP